MNEQLKTTFQPNFLGSSAWRLALHPKINVASARKLARASTIAKGNKSFLLHNTDQPDLAAKLIKYRSLPRDVFRKYVGGQARREYFATCKLREWGIPCPGVWGYAFSISPCNKYESLLILDYQKHHRNARRYLETTDDHHARQRLLDAIAHDIGAIYQRGFHHNDCHLGNVLVDARGHHVWIDNELRRVKNTRQLASRFEESLLLLDRSFKKSVDPRTKSAFLALCRHSAGIPKRGR